MDDHPPTARLIKAQVLFDTTVPRYFAVINECPVLRQAFPRALITTGVELELAKARRPVRASGGDLAPLLDDRSWAEVVELTGPQIVDVEQLRLAFHSPQELLEKETTDLGEFETVVASQALGGLPDRQGPHLGNTVEWQDAAEWSWCMRQSGTGTSVSAAVASSWRRSRSVRPAADKWE